MPFTWVDGLTGVWFAFAIVRLGDEPRAGEDGAMSMLEGEEGVRADDDYAKGESWQDYNTS